MASDSKTPKSPTVTLASLDSRLKRIEDMIGQAESQKKRELAKKLQEDPEKLAQMREVLALADSE